MTVNLDVSVMCIKRSIVCFVWILHRLYPLWELTILKEDFSCWTFIFSLRFYITTSTRDWNTSVVLYSLCPLLKSFFIDSVFFVSMYTNALSHFPVLLSIKDEKILKLESVNQNVIEVNQLYFNGSFKHIYAFSKTKIMSQNKKILTNYM